MTTFEEITTIDYRNPEYPIVDAQNLLDELKRKTIELEKQIELVNLWKNRCDFINLKEVETYLAEIATEKKIQIIVRKNVAEKLTKKKHIYFGRDKERSGSWNTYYKFLCFSDDHKSRTYIFPGEPNYKVISVYYDFQRDFE